MRKILSSPSAAVAVRWLVLLVATVWLAYFITSSAPQARPQVFRSTVLFQFFALLPAALFGVYLLLRRRLPGGSPLDWPLLAFVGVYLLATVASVAWRVSLESSLILLLAVLVFYALSDLHWLDTMGLQRAFMIAAAFAAFWALWKVGGDYLDWLRFAKSTGGLSLGNLLPPTVPKVHGVGDHPNILGMTLVLAMPFYVLGVYRPAPRWLRALWALFLFAALWAVFLTLSRGAWIGAAVAIVLTVAGLILAERSWSFADLRQAALSKSRTRVLLIAGGVAVLLLLVVAGAVLLTQSSVRPQWLFRESLSPRRDVFDAGVSLFRDHLLLGGGPGTFGLLYPQYSGAFPIHAIHAHNGFLQVADDAGLVGLAALAVLLASIAWMLWQSYQRGNTEQRLLAVACAGAFGGFAVHNLADAANIWKGALVAVAAVTAISVKNYRSLPPSEERPPSPRSRERLRRIGRYLPRGVLAVAFIALPLVWLPIDYAHLHYSHSVDELAVGNTAGAVDEARRAVDLDPDLAVNQLQLGIAEAAAYRDAEGPYYPPDSAIAAFQRAIDLDPRSAIAYANLARILADAGRNDEAEQAALQAKRYAGADDAVLLVTGTVLEDVGATDQAIQAYAQAINYAPSIADSSFWLDSDFRKAHYPEIISYSLISLSPCATGNLVAHISADLSPSKLQLSGLRDSCRDATANDPTNLGGRVELAQISMALNDYQTAHDLLTDVLNRQPDLAAAHTVMGEWYDAQGDVSFARAEWTTGGQLGDAESLLLLGQSYPAGQVPSQVVDRLTALASTAGGSARSYAIGWVYFRMKYDRQDPAGYVLPPGDWQNAVPVLYSQIQQALQQWRRDTLDPKTHTLPPTPQNPP